MTIKQRFCHCSFRWIRIGANRDHIGEADRSGEQPFRLSISFGSTLIATVTDRRYSLAMASLRFHVVPNANINKVVGEHGHAIKIKLRAPATEGKANAALRRFLAEKLSIPKNTIVLERGERSRHKVIRIDGLSEADAYRSLLETSRSSSTAIR
jgi:uncharacterized protein (TIGR00251 family)